MNFQQFNYILALVKLKHFEAAADSCYVAQSTLSTMINKCEDEIGIKIFNRKTKPVSITAEGVQIINRLRIIQKEIDALQNVIQELKGEMIGELRIGIIPTTASDLLPLFLSKFASDFPEIKMIVQELTTFEIQKALKNRTLDVGILAIPLNDDELIEFDLYSEPFLFYDCSASKLKSAIAIQELDYSKLWLLEEGHCLRTQVQNICELSDKNQEKNVNIEFKAGSLDSLLRFTRASNGVTILPYLASLSLSKSEQKKLVPFKLPTPVRSIGLVTHKYFVKKKLLNQLQVTICQVVAPLIPRNPLTKQFKPL